MAENGSISVSDTPDTSQGGGTEYIAEPLRSLAVPIASLTLDAEIEPRYVDVAIRRWQKLTGRHATLEGKTWEEVARERGVSVPV